MALAMTSPDGGLNTIDPVVRLSPLPSAKQPLLLELGVLQGGSEVLFVVQPGTILSGPAKCLPGKVDCQIISLAPNQIESLYVRARAAQRTYPTSPSPASRLRPQAAAAAASRSGARSPRAASAPARGALRRAVAVPVRAEPRCGRRPAQPHSGGKLMSLYTPPSITPAVLRCGTSARRSGLALALIPASR